MLTRPVTRPVVRSVCRNITGSTQRWALNFDGVGIRGVLANRAINPDGDIDIEWSQLNVVQSTWKTIVAQNIAAVNSAREFTLQISNANTLVVVIGGILFNRSEINYASDGRYRLTRVAGDVSVYRNGSLVTTFSAASWTVREPAAPTNIGCRLNDSTSAVRDFFQGVLYDVKINGTLWPIAERNQSIQLPEPSGLGAELFANPSLSNEASGWGRINATAVNEGQFLRLINTTPAAGFIFQTITTVAGVKYVARVNSAISTGTALRITINNGSSAAYTGSISNKNVAASEIGQQLFLEFEAISSQTTIGFFVNGATVGNSVVIEKVETKPLGTCNPMTISNAASTNWVEVPA